MANELQDRTRTVTKSTYPQILFGDRLCRWRNALPRWKIPSPNCQRKPQPAPGFGSRLTGREKAQADLKHALSLLEEKMQARLDQHAACLKEDHEQLVAFLEGMKKVIEKYHKSL